MSSEPIRIGFSKLEAVLGDMHGVAKSKRGAFQARLKYLHRLGFPHRLEIAHGKSTLYHPGHMVEMALALEMIQLGLPPERTVHVLALNRFPTFMAMRMASSWLMEKPFGFDPDKQLNTDPPSMFLYFDPAALSPLMFEDDYRTTPDIDQADDTFFYGGMPMVRDGLARWTSGPISRLAIINFTAVIDRCACIPFPEEEWDNLELRRTFFTEVNGWAEKMIEETYEHEAAYFLTKHLEHNYLAPSVEQEAEHYFSQLIEETGLRPETVQSALSDFIKKTLQTDEANRARREELEREAAELAAKLETDIGDDLRAFLCNRDIHCHVQLSDRAKIQGLRLKLIEIESEAEEDRPRITELGDAVGAVLNQKAE